MDLDTSLITTEYTDLYERLWEIRFEERESIRILQ